MNGNRSTNWLNAYKLGNNPIFHLTSVFFCFVFSFLLIYIPLFIDDCVWTFISKGTTHAHYVLRLTATFSIFLSFFLSFLFLLFPADLAWSSISKVAIQTHYILHVTTSFISIFFIFLLFFNAFLLFTDGRVSTMRSEVTTYTHLILSNSSSFSFYFFPLIFFYLLRAVYEPWEAEERHTGPVVVSMSNPLIDIPIVDKLSSSGVPAAEHDNCINPTPSNYRGSWVCVWLKILSQTPVIVVLFFLSFLFAGLWFS